MVEVLLGFARRARQLAVGSSSVEALLKRGRLRLLILAADASEGTTRRFLHLAGRRGASVYCYGTKESLGRLLGAGAVAMVGFQDTELCRSIEAYLGRSTEARRLRAEATSERAGRRPVDGRKHRRFPPDERRMPGRGQGEGRKPKGRADGKSDAGRGRK